MLTVIGDAAYVLNALEGTALVDDFCNGSFHAVILIARQRCRE